MIDVPGCLVLIVGPPGAGKDTLLERARRVLAEDTRIRFARRVVDNRREKRLDTHEPLDEASFTSQLAAGAFALSWRAEGHRYGVRNDILLDLAAGHVVVANVSRAVVAAAAEKFPVRLIELRVSADMLALRLVARGRADAVVAARRLARPLPLPAWLPLEVIVNEGGVEQGAAAVVAALLSAAESLPVVSQPRGVSQPPKR